jgi:hypothetical protein
MALTDPTQTITTALNDVSYTAGQEPWNRNLNQFKIDPQSTESSTYQCDFNKWHGIYRKIPEARSTIDLWCKWLIGKEIKMDEKTKAITDRIKGNGLDTFRTILTNHKRVSKICGDSYLEIIKDKAGRIINLTFLNPGTIKVEADAHGMIKHYYQVSVNTSTQQTIVLQDWNPEEIWHLSNDRIADEIHGIPELEKVYDIVRWKHQSMNDESVVFHRYVQPILDIYANTDDPVELASLKATYDKSQMNFENRIIPKGAIEKVERVSVPQYSTLDPLPWLIFLRSYFTEASNVPDLIRGKSDEVSLAAGKLNYLGFKEKIIMEQLEYKEQIKANLKLEVNFEEPKEIDVEIAKGSMDIQEKNKAKSDKEVTTGKSPNKTD